MEFYLVGGAVRDKILKINSKDKDFVVLNGSIEEMVKLGYKQVGKSFPVFIDPNTGFEYALARKEKKISKGHKSFEFIFSKDTTLIEDLRRRDLTINAIAQDKNGRHIDPFNGILDIQNKVLRHVSNAFIEDPLRLFRVARFSATLNFTVHPKTELLLKHIVNSKELLFLSKYRISSEFIKAVNSKNVTNFFNILTNCGALHQLVGIHRKINTIINDNKVGTMKMITNSNKYNFLTTDEKIICLMFFLKLKTDNKSFYNNAHQKLIIFTSKKDNEVLLLNLIENIQILTNFLKTKPEKIIRFFKKLNVSRNLVQLKSCLNIINVIFQKNNYKTDLIYNLAISVKNVKIDKMSLLSPTEIKNRIKNKIFQLIRQFLNENK